MAMNHQISSNAYDRYHGVVEAKELRSRAQHRRGSVSAGAGEEDSKHRLQVRDGLDRNFTHATGDGKSYKPRGKPVETGHSKNYDSYDFTDRKPYRQDAGGFLYGKVNNSFPGFSPNSGYQFTQITITHSGVFNGAHLGSLDKTNEAYTNFINAARSYIKNPGEDAYKSLNEAMVKLMNPNFAPANVGGAANVSIREVGGATMAKFTMEVTPAPTKTLEEAREDLKNAYSSRRDGEKGIADIRAEAYANYVRAMSEKFKQDGVISHTNNTPTTPVYQSSVIYISKTSQSKEQSFHELKKPEFKHNLSGKLSFKNRRGFWDSYRQNQRSYVDLLKNYSKKPHYASGYSR